MSDVETAMLNWNDVAKGLRIICVSEYWNRRSMSGNHADVYHQTGTIREVDLEARKFWIEWDDPYYNATPRGQLYWDQPNYFALASEDQIKSIKSRVERLKHAMSYL